MVQTNRSTLIKYLDYSNGSLLVAFRSTNAVYEYSNVPMSIYLDLCTCNDIGYSVGARLSKIVKGKFNHRKVGS